LAARRLAAARLRRAGLSQSEVARRVGVHRQSVNRWARELEPSGMRGLRPAGHTGRPAKLNRAQLHELEGALKRGAAAVGYQSGRWTAGRVRQLIAYQTGV
jgi:transposase